MLPDPPTVAGAKGKLICTFMAFVFIYVIVVLILVPEGLGRDFDIEHDVNKDSGKQVKGKEATVSRVV